MKTTQRTYVLTMNSSPQKGFRLWTGKNIHALRHCSVTQVGQALRDMQREVDALRGAASAASSTGSYSLNRGR